ncbi:MAG: sensor histidine kinase [Gemmatimonadota bacterium]
MESTQTKSSHAILGAFLGIALLFGLVEAGQVYVGTGLRGNQFSLGVSLLHTVPGWLLLGMLAIAVYSAAGRFPLSRGKLHKHLPLHIAGATVFAVLHLAGTAAFSAVRAGDWGVLGAEFSRLFSFYFALDILLYFAVIGTHHAIGYYQEARSRERAALTLELDLREARLQALQSRLNPHFLFNTLNTASSLALEGEREAVTEVLGRLSEVLRYYLDHSTEHEVELSRELRITEDYLAIQRIRFGERLSVEWDIDGAMQQALVPTMLLQPLVENAISHGIAAQRGSGTVRITARPDKNRLRIAVEDSGPGFSPNTGDGIGLATTRERLENLYGSECELICGNGGNGGGSVTVSLPFRLAASANVR